MSWSNITPRKGKQLRFNKKLAEKLNTDERFRAWFIPWREKHQNPGISGVDRTDPSGRRKVSLSDVCHLAAPLNGIVNHAILDYDDKIRHATLQRDYPELQKASSTKSAPSFNVVMSTSVPDTVSTWVDSECARTGLTKSDVIRAALLQVSGLSNGEEPTELRNLSPVEVSGTGRKVPVTLSLSGPLVEAIEHVGGRRNRSATVERLLREMFSQENVAESPKEALRLAKRLINNAVSMME